MDKNLTIPKKDEDKASRLVEAIKIAFLARAKKGDENTLLTLAYSTDP